MLCKEYNLISIDNRDNLCKILCYPVSDNMCCETRVKELMELNIDEIYSFGKLQLDKNIYVVGKGHAAIVVLAYHRSHGVIGLKIRRVDSKKFSMEWEAYIISRVESTGFAPKLYDFSTNFLVREFIDGFTLEEMFKLLENNRSLILKLVENLLKAALVLDEIEIDLNEISRPMNQVVYLCGDPLKLFFIDFESAKLTPRSSNITKLLGFIVNGFIAGKKISEILGIDENKKLVLINLAKEYRVEKEKKKRKDLASKIIEIIIN